LSVEERTALSLPAPAPAGELRLRLGERTLSRTELMLGLSRMDSKLPFETPALRGGGFPNTLQGASLSREVVRLQVRELYPDFTDAQVDELLAGAGAGAQALLERLTLQLRQLHTDLVHWIEQTVSDLDDMDLDFLAVGDEGAAGMTPQQVAAHNAEMLEHVIEY
ncbi:hypothetical protein C4E44_34810, partial [Pseudomonas sp. MWU12-2312b]